MFLLGAIVYFVKISGYWTSGFQSILGFYITTFQKIVFKFRDFEFSEQCKLKNFGLLYAFFSYNLRRLTSRIWQYTLIHINNFKWMVSRDTKFWSKFKILTKKCSILNQVQNITESWAKFKTSYFAPSIVDENISTKIFVMSRYAMWFERE